MPDFTCTRCGRPFTVPEKTLAKYPSWTPKLCLKCHADAKPSGQRNKRPRNGAAGGSSAKVRVVSATRDRDLSLAEVLSSFDAGPKTGVFTDGAAHPNPGPGGWGVVYVEDDEIIEERRGSADDTTNNRMELTALIEGYRMVPDDKKLVMLTDSRLCVNTINLWAKGWAQNGWKRKGGPIKNLDLVQELYALAQSRPLIEVQWIQAHSGYRWNEYADSLASAYRRAEL